ncbi:MAG: hypothetical protein Q9221_000585 [Calogaya cf. arnoldii]
MPTQPYKSHLSIPYTSPPTPLQTLDLHLPTTPPGSPSTPSYTILYIHGGAFRDPLITSQSLLPSLPFLFSSKSKSPISKSSPCDAHDDDDDGNQRIAAIVSVNYRLTPYPTHPSHPSEGGDESRNAKWPDQVRDVRAAMRWLFSGHGSMEKRGSVAGSEIILVGHSVGATVAFGVALGLGYRDDDDDRNDFQHLRQKIRAVVGVEGIYDFAALRDAHLEYRGIYEEFTNGAFGDEESGSWEKGDVVRMVREGGDVDAVKVVVLGQSRGDELAEWGQVEMMEQALQEKGWRGEEDVEGMAKEIMVVELKGRHDEIWEKDAYEEV